MKRYLSAITPALGLLLILSVACTGGDGPETEFEYAPEEAAAELTLAPEQAAFWENVQQLCGNAYRGVLADATPYYHGSAADRIVIHVRNCTETLTHISLHMDDDHSRNLMLTKADGTLRLKHDHRNEDGTEEDITQY